MYERWSGVRCFGHRPYSALAKLASPRYMGCRLKPPPWELAVLKALLVMVLLVPCRAAAGGWGGLCAVEQEGHQLVCGGASPSWGPGSQNDLIRYGRDLVVNTARHIGKNATKPALALCRQRPRLPELPSECRAPAFCRAFRMDLRDISDDGR